MLFFKYRLPSRYFYHNINIDYDNKKQKRVLISYITSGFAFEEKMTHTNIKEVMQIMQCFIKKGFVIDVIHCNNPHYLSEIDKIKYDIIFGFGEVFFHTCKLNLNAVKIIYLTESYPEYSRQQEEIRYNYYYQRHHRTIKYERTDLYYQKEYFKYVDYGILVGNEFTKKTFAQEDIPLFLTNPTGIQNEIYKFVPRNLKKTKKNFIWFGSYGAIHKGLDLLVDVFASCPECTLYVCGLNKHEKRKVSFMDQYDNIIDLGFMNVESESFIELVNSCSYTILPSCSEGMATSVLTCMNHSLIPVVTENCGIDVFDFGFLLKDYHVEYIKKIVLELSGKSDAELEKMHQRVYEYSRNNFTIHVFSQRFEKILNDILRGENHTAKDKFCGIK